MAVQLAILAAWIGAFVGGSYLPGIPHGHLHLSIAEATTTLLSVLWQVQATSVGLVFTVVVFVFGFLPQGRGRLTYREFLRRTWALQLTIFNVASLLFNGMVLLGVGHQVQATNAAPGHGWAVTMASVVALASIVTIVALLVRTVRAVNPATTSEVQREYQRAAVAMAVRDELTEIESLRIMTAGDWPFGFVASYPGPGPGRTIRESGPGRGVVRDVSPWRLGLLKRASSWARHDRPVVHVWPGKPVAVGTPLITSGLLNGWLGFWWGRQCVRVRPVRSDQLGGALTALYGETLDQIRASRAAEAIDGIRALGSLQKLLWLAYAAHGRAYGPESGQSIMLSGRGAGERIDELLDDLLRAAALSGDDAIRREATALPMVMARDAVSEQQAYAASLALRHLEAIYVTVFSELSDGGQHDLPCTELARSRLDAPFRTLLSFVNYYLGQSIDQAAAGDSNGWDGKPLPPADFLVGQLTDANEAMLQILRRAVRYRDSATVTRVLDAWKMPELHRITYRAQQAGIQPSSGTSQAGDQQSLEQSLSDADASLNSMLLRLLVTALDADRAATPREVQPLSGAHGDRDIPDQVSEAILDHLPNDSRLWDILYRALQTSSRDWRPQMTADRIIPAGVPVGQLVDTASPLMEAFALAAIARPDLAAGSDPDPRLTLEHGPALHAAIDKALADHMPWLEQHGSTPENARRNAASLKTQLGLAQQEARRHLDEEIRTSPILPEAEEELRLTTLAAFRGSDITGALFAWAGKLASGTSSLAIQQETLTCPRSTFTAIGYIDGVMGNHAQRLGYYLAASSLGQLTYLARQNANERDVRREDLAAAVRDAIAEVSGTPAGEASNAPAARTVVLIPDSWALKADLGIAATAHADLLEAARSDVIRNLDLQDKGLASRIVGAIDGAPVVEVTVNAPGQDNWVLVIDLTRFGELRRGSTDGTFSAEPTMELVQPDDPLRPSTGTAVPSASPALGQQPGLLEVRVILSLATDIETNDRSAVRVIRIGAPPQRPHAPGAT